MLFISAKLNTMKKNEILGALFLLLSITITAQSTITVDNSAGADAQYDDLQTAINAANSGDIIYVHASEVNYSSITIDKPITLIGYSHSDSDKITMVDDITLGENASNTRITGLQVLGDFLVDNSATISNLIIENNFFNGVGTGLFIEFRDGGADNVIIRGNVIIGRIGTVATTATSNTLTNALITNNIVSGTIYVRFHESTTIENNIFLNESLIRNTSSSTGDLEVQDCIFYASRNSVYDPNSSGVIFNNCLTFNDSSGVTNLAGSNNINDTDPLFVSADDDFFDPLIDDYNLQTGSPALGAGVSGDNIGIYSTNTSFQFNNLGFTAGIPTVTITAITSQVAPGGNLQVTIQSKSN
jgi:hypothetical protein